MEKLRLRCPTCSKLYEVSDSDISSATPHFDCISCASRFTFDYPVRNFKDIATRVIFQNPATPETLSFQQELENQIRLHQTTSAPQQQSHSCPKCGAANNKGLAECYSCHVIFEKMLELPLDPTLRAQPSLVRKWKNLVLNFDNAELHEDFLKSCHELDALRFAILKYEDLQKAQGGKDDVCESMIYKAHGLLQVTLYSRKSGDPFHKKESSKTIVSWHKYVFFTPLIVSALMMLSGFTSLAQRNLVGAGVAVMLLTFGLTLFWKGRVSISDFIR